VETPGGKLSGEIPVCLKQSSSRFWRVAAALGLAVTAQGLVGAGKLLTQVSYSPAQALSEFKPADHYTIFFLLSIPTAWMGLRAADWLYYQIVR
jgi:hypothetical protein